MKKNYWGVMVIVLIISGVLAGCGSGYATEQKLCEAAFAAPVESGVPGSPVLMLTNKTWNDNGWDKMTQPLIPDPGDADAQTLVCIRQSRTQTDDVYYVTIANSETSIRADATPYQLTWDIRLIELPTGSVIAGETFQGGDPPESVSVSDSDEHVDVYGDGPTPELFKMLRPVLGPIFFTGHDINEIAFSPDGRFLASAGGFNLDLVDPFLMMWDVSSGETAATFDNPDSNECLAFSPDGRALATCEISKKLRLWDTSSGKLLYEMNTGDYLRTAAYSPDGSLLAAGGDGDDLFMLNAASGEVVYQLPIGPVKSLSFSPDGKILAVGSNQPIQLLEPATGKQIATFGPAGTTCLSISPDGKRLAANRGLWDIASRQIVQTFEDGLGCAFSPDGAWVAQGQLHGEVFLWNTNTGEKAAVIEGFKGSIDGLAFSPDGKWLAIASADDEMILLYDMAKVK